MRHLPLLLATLALAGCNYSKPAQPPQAASAATQAASAATQVAADQGLTPPAVTVQGKVLEHLEAAPFSYLRLQTDKGEIWAGVPQADLKPGATVKVVGAYPMENFVSKKANRTFAKVYLGTLEGQTTAAVDSAHGGATAPSAGASPHGPGMSTQAALPGGAKPLTADAIIQSMSSAAGTSKTTNPIVEKTPKAAGNEARTVAEVHAQSAGLKDRSVSIRGKVVKFNAQIMGRNWLHLQDGSGDPKAGTHDITVTSDGTAKVGEVVTVKGTVRLKKDFGAGYAYEVIVEDAKVSH